MKKIIKDNIVYAVYDNTNFDDMLSVEGTLWLTENNEAIQASRMNYNKDKIFKAHKHIIRPRLNNYTQEAIVVVKGKVAATIYDNNGDKIAIIILNTGSIGIFHRGGHSFEVIENGTIFYEIKNGEFTTVKEDKVFLEEK